MAQPSWDFPSGAREEKRREEKRREAREEKIRESREERTREPRESRDFRESFRESSRESSRESLRDPIDDKLRKYSEKPGKSPRSLPALPSSALPDRGAPFQRLVCFLTCLPLGLALFAFLVLDPPVDPSPSGFGLPSSLGNSTADLQTTQPGCSRAVKKGYLFPSRPWHSSLQPAGYPRVSHESCYHTTLLMQRERTDNPCSARGPSSLERVTSKTRLIHPVFLSLFPTGCTMLEGVVSLRPFSSPSLLRPMAAGNHDNNSSRVGADPPVAVLPQDPRG